MDSSVEHTVPDDFSSPEETSSEMPTTPTPAEQASGYKRRVITRRGLIGGVAGIVVLAAVGGIGVAVADDGGILRPPGGQDRTLLLGACIRCDRCRSICPQGVIDVVTIEQGFESMRTPKMNFRIGYCDTCDGEYRCIEACSTGALTAFDPQQDKIGLAIIDYSQCLTYGISGSCDGRCITNCPAEALAFNDNRQLIIDNSLCWGCGLCEYICPANSYGSYNGSENRGINIREYEGNRNE